MKKVLSVAVLGLAVLTGCDKSAKNGDTVVIDFAGFLGPEQFEGGTAQNVPLKLGSHSFIPGFEEQLIGAKVGEERNITVKFPADYPAANLAGKETLFRVKVNAIK
ncbi:MAG: FKBP-type peptidyl-prolyl cis-trans isomerase [Rickettsiales bacterium]|jgi:trigger factor|nr:FKBP-type peptidyl-prolyl cis-trans isomerase [Rickettsiales bacterium]